MAGQLSRIDLIIPDENEELIIGPLSSNLPQGTRLVSSGSRTDPLSQMTRAFELNLQALSLLALLVGMFLIYNTMTFSVVQRLPLIGRLRALGVTKSEILFMIIREAMLIGLIGTMLGITAGIGLAQLLLGLVTQSINDLYFVLSVQELTIDLVPVLKAVTLGLGATLMAAFWPGGWGYSINSQWRNYRWIQFFTLCHYRIFISYSCPYGGFGCPYASHFWGSKRVDW